MTTLLLLFDGEKIQKNLQSHKKMSGVILGLLTIMCVYGIFNEEYFLNSDTIFLAKKGADDTKYISTEEEDNIYIWHPSLYNKYPIHDFMQQGKMPTTRFLEHNIPAGGQRYNQVYFKEHLKTIGIGNPARALLERENTFYVDEDCSLVLTFLREHYNSQLEARQVGDISGVPVWKFEISNTN